MNITRPRATHEAIASAFGVTERPIKRLIRDYFVQFDAEYIKKGKGPVLKNGSKLKVSEVPKEYADMAGMLKLIHSDSSKNMFDTNNMKPDSLMKIPPSMGHLTIPQCKNADGTISMWALDLHLRNKDAVFDRSVLTEFCAKAEPDAATAETLVLKILGGFFPSCVFVFDLIKSKNPVMATLTLAYNQTSHSIIIEDSRFPIAPNKRLVVKMAKKDDIKEDK